MTQLNSKSIDTILQEALSKDGDFLKEMVKNPQQNHPTTRSPDKKMARRKAARSLLLSCYRYGLLLCPSKPAGSLLSGTDYRRCG